MDLAFFVLAPAPPLRAASTEEDQMPNTRSIPVAIAAAAMASLTLAACAEDASVREDRFDAAADSLIAGDPARTMSDPQIIGFLSLVNEAEIEAGQLALGMATDQRVRQFAQRLVRDHRQLLQQDERLVGQTSIQPEAPPRDYLATMHRETMNELRDLEGGAAFDSAFVASQLEAHRAVLDELRLVSASSQRITEHLRASTGVVETHLEEAERLQRALRGGGGGGGG